MNLAVLDKSSEKDGESASLIEEGHQPLSIKTTHGSSSTFSPLLRLAFCNTSTWFFFSFQFDLPPVHCTSKSVFVWFCLLLCQTKLTY